MVYYPIKKTEGEIFDLDIRSLVDFVANIAMQLIIVYCLLKPYFRYSVRFTLIVAALLSFSQLLASEIATGAYQWIYGVVLVLSVLLLLPLMRKGTRAMMAIAYMMCVYIYNMIGTAIAAVLTTIYGLITGSSNQTWFTEETMTDADYVLRWIGVVISYAVAIWLARRYMVLLEYLTEREKTIFAFATLGVDSVFSFFTRTVITSAEQMLAGIIVTLYGVYVVWLGVFLALALILPLVRLRSENKKLEQEMRQQYLYYQNVLETQGRLREIRHDLKNRIIAETLAGERKEQ